MYKIIGTDQKEYGPISTEQLKQWLNEGRANANTLIQPVGSTDWKPLHTFPELGIPAPLGTYAQPPLVSPIDPLKSKLAAGLLGIFLGGLGIHRFYLGYITIGVVQLIVTIVTCGFGAIWGLIEGILIIAGTTIVTDAKGRPLRE